MAKEIGMMIERLDEELIMGRISEKTYKKLKAKYVAQIESGVYGHVKRHGGELDVETCAKEFGVSGSDVMQAVRPLVEKGELEREE